MEAKKGRRGTGRTNRKTSRGVCVSVHHNDGSQDSSSLKALTRVYDTSHTELSYNLTCGTGARGECARVSVVLRVEPGRFHRVKYSIFKTSAWWRPVGIIAY